MILFYYKRVRGDLMAISAGDSSYWMAQQKMRAENAGFVRDSQVAADNRNSNLSANFSASKQAQAQAQAEQGAFNASKLNTGFSTSQQARAQAQSEIDAYNDQKNATLSAGFSTSQQARTQAQSEIDAYNKSKEPASVGASIGTAAKTGTTSTKSSNTKSKSSSKVVSSASAKSASKKSGVNKKIARKAYNNVKKDLQDLEKYMNKLVEDVEIMNKSYWYGDKLANDWYKKMRNHYSENKDLNLVKFYNGVASFQQSLETVFKNAGLNKISF